MSDNSYNDLKPSIDNYYLEALIEMLCYHLVTVQYHHMHYGEI